MSFERGLLNDDFSSVNIGDANDSSKLAEVAGHTSDSSDNFDS